MLLGCYRSGDANDPEVYVGAVIASLSDYPAHVVSAVVDPRTGLPSKLKFLPTIAEIKSACEDEYRSERYAREWEGRAESMRALPPPDHTPRPKNSATRTALCERYGLKQLPPGWDAVDVAKAAATHGADLPRVVAELLASRAKGRTVFSDVVDGAAKAMKEAAE